jgi:undecaprenyl-diphosphatase
VIAVAVGLSRIYLRADWMSDVTGGAGLAAAVFSLCGILALVVSYVRHNEREPRLTRPSA